MKVSRLLIPVLFMIFTVEATAQKSKAFVGKIVYKNSFESKVPRISSEMMGSMMGQQWDYYISRDRYKFIMNGMHIEKQFYDPDELRLYTKFTSSDTLTWIDVTEWHEEIRSHELIHTEEFILGHKCNALILYTEQGKETYYFNKHIKADADYFQKHKFLHMSFVLKMTGSIPLKIVLENSEMNLISEAVEIEELELDRSDFDLPDLPSQPSTF